MVARKVKNQKMSTKTIKRKTFTKSNVLVEVENHKEEEEYNNNTNKKIKINVEKDEEEKENKIFLKKNAIENKNNCFFNIIIDLEQVVKKHLETYENKKNFIFPEIEIRLGRCVYNVYNVNNNENNNEKKKVYNKFKNGTEDIFWNNVLYMFNQYNKWLYIKDWEFKIDYIYKPITNHLNHVTMEPEEEKENHPSIDAHTTYRYTKGKNFNWIEKRTFNDIVLESQILDLYDAKISISNEKNINYNYIPEKKKLSWVRMKNRKSFILASEQDSNLPMWRYDLTMVWEGADNEEAVINYNNNQPLLEIECECINPYKFLQTNNYFNLCNNLINKFKDLVYPFFIKQIKLKNEQQPQDEEKENSSQMMYNIINNKNYILL